MCSKVHEGFPFVEFVGWLLILIMHKIHTAAGDRMLSYDGGKITNSVIQSAFLKLPSFYNYEKFKEFTPERLPQQKQFAFKSLQGEPSFQCSCVNIFPDLIVCTIYFDSRWRLFGTGMIGDKILLLEKR